jgi:mycoredoxin
MPSSTPSSVTVYGADWCGACKILERGLKERDIPFEVVDVDRNPDAHSRARAATGTSAIPVTNVVHAGDGTWIVGADVPAVERAYRGH